MLFPENPLPSHSRDRSKRNLLRFVDIAVEILEQRALFCSIHDGADIDALAPTSSVILDALADATPKGPVIDHVASWYKASRKVTIDATQMPKASTSVAVKNADTASQTANDVSFNVNPAGLPLLTERADGAGLKVFLDFDGYGSDIPFSIDADTTTFTTAEQKVIYNAWRDIVSYYSAFNVNVTTVQPPTGGSNPAFVWQRITDSVSGGAAYVGAINNNSSMGWTDDSNAINRTSGIAHEIGHQLNLQHQSDWDNDNDKVNEYSSGYTAHGPIIGVDYAQSVHKWFYGRNSLGADTLQDDIAKIDAYIVSKGSYGDGFMPDDFTGTTFASATALSLTNGSYQTAGDIERAADADFFSFNSDGSAFNLNVEPTFESAIAPKLEIYDSTGTLIAAKDDTSYRSLADNAGEEVTVALPAGTYFAKVSGHGDYGDVGEYAFFASPLPAGWNTTDIRNTSVGRGGYVTVDATSGAFYQGGSGAGITSNSDGLRFSYQAILGNGEITARVTGLDNQNNSASQLPMAGLMMRESLAYNGRYAAVAFKNSGSAYAVRGTAGATATTTNVALSLPNWVRLTRSGSIITLSQSTDGITFTTVGTVALSSLAQVVYFGLMTTSANTKQIANASFTDVSLTGTPNPVTPTVNNSLPAPIGFTATAAATQSTAITLNWTDGADETAYSIDRSVDGVTWALATTASANATTYTDNQTFGSMRYWYRISAVDAAGKSVYSDAVSVVNKPKAPTNGQAVAISTTKLSLTWRDTSGDNGYRVEQSADGGATYTVLGNTAANITGWNVTGLTAAKSYSYRITPLSAVGDGVPLVFTGVTALPAVTGLAFTSKLIGNVGLTWTDITGETGYRVERSTDNAAWSTVGTTAAGVTTFTDTTAVGLTHYYYRVFGTITGGESLNGGVIFFTTPPATAIPAPWADTDMGSPGGSGAGFVSGTSATVIGSGNTSAGGTTDQFNYLYRPLSGDGEIIAHVASMEGVTTTTKAGVMIRESLASNSKYAAVLYQSTTGTSGTDSFYRATTGSAGVLVDGQTATSYTWVRLVRLGTTITSYTSTSGAAGSWVAIGSPVTISMAATVYVGLATSSRDNTLLAKATFDNIAITGSLAPAVSSFAVNDGSAQRSMVKSLTLTFNQPMALSASGLVLQKKQVDGSYATVVGRYTVTPAVGDGTYATSYVVNFTDVGNSVADGVYRLNLSAAGTTNAGGATLAADQSYAFTRIFGDLDGDGTVSITDFNTFATAFGKSSGDAGFNAAFDSDADGAISIIDFNEFSVRFGVTI